MSKSKNGGNKDPFEAIRDESGNAFHARVASQLRANNWEVRLSPYYVDTATDIAREVDLLCEKIFPYKGGEQSAIAIRVQLVAECKYVPKESSTVFWFDTLDEDACRKDIKRQIRGIDGSTWMASHHYFQTATGAVAKLFASKKTGGDKEQMYVAISQVMGALVQAPMLGRLTKPMRNYREISVVYPVIICQDFERFRRTNIGSADASLSKMERNFLSEVHYAYNAKMHDQAEHPVSKYSLIDVVAYSRIKSFLDLLEKESRAIADELLN